jgi:hypothetical protein
MQYWHKKWKPMLRDFMREQERKKENGMNSAGIEREVGIIVHKFPSWQAINHHMRLVYGVDVEGKCSTHNTDNVRAMIASNTNNEETETKVSFSDENPKFESY